MRLVRTGLLLLSLLSACGPSASIVSTTDASSDGLSTDVSKRNDATLEARVDGSPSSDLGASDATADGASTDATATDGARPDAPPGDAPSGDTPLADGALVDRASPVDAASDTPVALEVTPAMTTLRVTSTTARPSTRFTVTGRTRDGRAVPVTAIWTTSPSTIATAAADGTVTATGVSGGDVTVTARSGTLAASATLRVVIDVTVSTMGTPADTGGLFAGDPTADATRAPGWIYPANETVFPQNLNRVLFQWRPSSNNRFRVTFESDRSRVVVLTDGANATCARAAATGLSCFEPELAVWRYLAASNPHGSVRVTIDGALSTAPGRYYRSATLSVAFSRGPVPGAIYYWSTTARGVRRGNLEEEQVKQTAETRAGR